MLTPLAAVILLLSRVRLFVNPWTAAHQASLSFTISRRLLRFMSIEAVMLSKHVILCHPLILPSVFLSIRVFSNELALCVKWLTHPTCPLTVWAVFPRKLLVEEMLLSVDSFFLYWSIVDLQLCVRFRCIAVIRLYIYIYLFF